MIRCRYVVLSARKKKSNCCELIPVMLRQAGLKETQWYGLLAWLGLAKWLVAWLGSWLIYPMMAWKSSRLTAWQWFGYRIDKFFSDSLPCMRTTIILCTFTCKMHSSALYSLAILDLTLTRPATSGVAFPYQSINGKRMFLILRTSRMPNLYIIYIYIYILSTIWKVWFHMLLWSTPEMWWILWARMEAEMRAVAKSAARHVGNEHGNHACVANHMAVFGAASVGVRQ